MNNGWVKLHRSLMDSSIWGNSDLTRAAVCCLLRANHKPGKVLTDGKVIDLAAGQFITGRNSWHNSLYPCHREADPCSRTTWRWLQNLSMPGVDFVSLKASSHYTVVTVYNWDTYQAQEEQQCPNECPSDVQTDVLAVSTACPSDVQAMSTNKKDKTSKNLENVKNSEKTPIVPTGGSGVVSADEAPAPTATRFTPPTLAEVQDYLTERQSSVDPEAFHAYYESCGWKVGSKPMKSWKAAVVTWEKRNARDGVPAPASNGTYTAEYPPMWPGEPFYTVVFPNTIDQENPEHLPAIRVILQKYRREHGMRRLPPRPGESDWGTPDPWEQKAAPHR